MQDIQEDNKEKYLNTYRRFMEDKTNKGLTCPYCDFDEIVFDRPEEANGQITMVVTCTECASQWSEIYELVDIKPYASYGDRSYTYRAVPSMGGEAFLP